VSAADHIHPGQLAMLMPAHQVEKVDYGDAYKQTPESRAHMVEEKSKRNAPLIGPPAPHQQPMEPYMDEPISLWHSTERVPSIWDGHHRLVHALDTNPNRELLVSHDSPEAMKWREQRDLAKIKKKKRR
jgi:hypothetical protein